jgi:hypothetical protein
LDGDITGKDESIVAQAIAIAAVHLKEVTVPQALLQVAPLAPLALYIAVKYLQSLPEWDGERINEHPMKAILLGRYSEFVEQARKIDPEPADFTAGVTATLQ